jgi:uncharacterized C2H2 Zn-finger protein
MEAVGATGISSTSTFLLSLNEMPVSTKNIYKIQITQDEQKLPIQNARDDKQDKDILKYKCVACGAILRNKRNVIRHFSGTHGKKGHFIGNYFKITDNIDPGLNCPECKVLFKHDNSLRNHLNKYHELRGIFEHGSLVCTINKSTGERKIYGFTNNTQAINIKETTPKSQDNTNATNTTTDNMDSTRKRSHSPATHEEESNAKKAMFNPSESGYPQSAPASENIDDKELLELVQQLVEADNNFKTDVIKCTDICSTDVQLSATSENIDDKELLELVQELIQTNNDLNTGELLAKAFTSGMI